MKKYRVFVRGENFLIRVNDAPQRLGFYTTVFVDAKDPSDAERKAIDLLRNNQRLTSCVTNSKSDSPMMFAEEIEELESFPAFNPPRIGFSFFTEEEAAAEAEDG